WLNASLPGRAGPPPPVVAANHGIINGTAISRPVSGPATIGGAAKNAPAGISGTGYRPKHPRAHKRPSDAATSHPIGGRVITVRAFELTYNADGTYHRLFPAPKIRQGRARRDEANMSTNPNESVSAAGEPP